MQEEYERTGVHEAVKSPDPNKPPPEYVLRTFSHGFGFEDAFLDLCAEAHNSPHQVSPQEEGDNFVKSIRSLTDVSDLHKLEAHAGSSIFHGEPKYQCMERKNDSTLPQGSFPKTGDDVISLEHRDGFNGPAPIIEEMLSTGTIETSITKVTCQVFVYLLFCRYACMLLFPFFLVGGRAFFLIAIQIGVYQSGYSCMLGL